MNSLHWLDYAVVAFYLLGSIGLGIYFSKKQTRDEFFAAGRSMGWLTVGLSVMATLFSANSFNFYPAAAYGDGLKIGLALISFAAITPLIIWVFVPVYSRLRCETAYEYLEKRFGVSVRSLASGLFIFLRIGWMASATFAASVAISGISGVDQYVIIISLGVVAIVYTMLGGLRAVMWTDVLQFFVFAITIAITLWLLVGQIDGGLSGMMGDYFRGREKIVADFTPSMTLKYGSWAILLGFFLEALSAFGADQVAVQRYIAARDEKTAQIGFLINLAGMWVVIPGLLLIGVGLYSYFQHHPQDLAPVLIQHIEKELVKNPGGNDESPAVAKFRGADTAAMATYYQQHPEQVEQDVRALKLHDQALPRFVRLRLPPGVVGLLLAALMAATMSSIDSGIHSVTTAIIIDFRDRLFPSLTPKTQAAETRVARMLVVAIGTIAVALACVVKPLGDVFDVATKLTAAFGGPLLAVFILAFFFRRVSTPAVFIGALLAAAATLGLMYLNPLWFSKWFWPIGFGLTIAIALPISLAPWGKPSAADPPPLTYWEVIRQSRKDHPDNQK